MHLFAEILYTWATERFYKRRHNSSGCFRSSFVARYRPIRRIVRGICPADKINKTIRHYRAASPEQAVGISIRRIAGNLAGSVARLNSRSFSMAITAIFMQIQKSNYSLSISTSTPPSPILLRLPLSNRIVDCSGPHPFR